MKKKKMLFVASLMTKKKHYDGETHKSSDILDILKKEPEYKITTINYSKNKYIQTIKLIFLTMFKKYDTIFVPKCIVGGSIAIHYINKFGKKHNRKVISMYIYGTAFLGFEDKTIYFEDIAGIKNLIVESEMAKKLMEDKGCKNISVFPCVKPLYDIKPLEREYSGHDTLKLIFFSRLTPVKWPDKIIDAVIKINEKYKRNIFELDLAGGIPPESIGFSKDLENKCSHYEYIHYYSDTFMVKGLETYLALQKYDLHVLPTVFVQENVPGSIIDMFIAGVPTLSSDFPNSKTILNEENSYFFKQGDFDDLVNKLEYIYLNQKGLSKRRLLSFNEYAKYTPSSLINFLKEINI